MDEHETQVRAAVERYAQAWQQGDLGAIVESYHDDFTLHYFGSNALSGTHVGKRASLTALAEFGRRTKRKLLAVVAMMAGPERGGLIVREALTGHNESIEVERLLVYAVRDGRLSECWVYDSDQALIDRLIGKT